LSFLQYCNSSDLLKREQHFLDILFSLPTNFRYNFSPTAGSCLGVVRYEETRAKLSEANSGANNPMYGRTGALNPMYGKVPANAFQSGIPSQSSKVWVWTYWGTKSYIWSYRDPQPIILCMVKFLLML